MHLQSKLFRLLLCLWLTYVHTKSCSGAMCQHEARVQSTVLDQKCWKLTVGCKGTILIKHLYLLSLCVFAIGTDWYCTWVDEPLDPPLAHGCQLVNSDGEVIQRLGRVLPVKVAGRDDLSAVGENDGIVGAAVHLGRHDSAHELDGVMHNAMDLWRAT